MTTFKNIKISDLVPDNLKNDPNVKASIDALENEFKEISELCKVPTLYARIDSMDGNHLDHLAWQLKSNVWRDSWPTSLKRSVIKTVISEKTKRGTKQAVVDAVDAFGSGAQVQEWFENGGEPHTFNVNVSLSNMDNLPIADQQAHLLLRIDDVKPLRSRCTLTLALQAVGKLGLSAGGAAGVFTRLISQGIPSAALGAGEFNMVCGETTSHSRS